jgi:DNA gyrase subunit A
LAILAVSNRGYGKRTPVEAFRLQKRGGSGIVGFNVNSKSGNLIGVLPLTEQFDVLLISERGQALRINSGSIALQRRTAAGNRLIKLDEGDAVASITATLSELPETKMTRRR